MRGVDVKVDADTTKAKKKLERIEREKHTATIDVEVDKASLARARAQIGGGGGRGGGVGLGGLGGPAAVFGATQSQTAIEHLSLPYDPATRRLFGVPVTTSNAQAAGVGHVLASGAVALGTDTRPDFRRS
jgi:hypothetical protein